ncbi:MAG: ATP-binding protein [Armatimonadetes bacterium]|nr:ATP-binding protein [Armatimonadota bacterium]
MDVELFRLTLPALPDSVGLAGACAAEAARTVGFDPRGATQLRLAAEEAVANAVQHAYRDSGQGQLEVRAERVGNGLRVLVRDWGMPLYELPDESSMHGLHRIRELTDRVFLHNLGRGGKEVELLKQQARPAAPEPLPAEPEEPAEMEVRPMRPEDAAGVCRCFYAGYGYTYGYEDLYFPERLIELNQSGILTSLVAVTPRGRVVGHSALALEEADSVCGELGMAIVDPGYRGHHLFARMFGQLADIAKRRRLTAVYGHAVSIHPVSQHVLHQFGMQDTAIMLGYAPPSLDSQKAGAGERQTLILAAKRFEDGAPRPRLYPGRHRAMVESLLGRLGYEPVLSDSDGPLPEHSVMSSSTSAGLNVGTLTFRTVGQDAARLAAAALRQLCLRHVDVVQCYANLADPGLTGLVQALERLGFFFAGVHPGWSGGDALVMQFLNNLEVDISSIQLESPETRRLVDYVLECQAERLELA